MATVQKFLPFDNSTLANFLAWVGGISDALGNTFGWVQAPDTGQVVLTATVLTLTQVTVGASAVYSYSSYAGPAPRIGMSVIVTGFATGGNNVTGTLTAISGGASGTVTMALTTQANETHAGSGTTTALAAVPSSTYVYQIWVPTDALQTGATAYYLKMEYGFSTTIARIRLSLAHATDGAGTLTAPVNGPYLMPATDVANQGAITFECNFSGDSGRAGMMLWRMNLLCWGIYIERTLATDGTPDSTVTAGVTLITTTTTGSSPATINQRTLVFAAGLANLHNYPVTLSTATPNGDSFNNKVPVSPVFPDIGQYGNPMTVVANCMAADVAEGALLQTTLYGATRTYLASAISRAASQFGSGILSNTFVHSILMRYD